MSLLIEKNFNNYNLPDYEKFVELINRCAADSELFRLLPYLLRNLFENLLYFIFRDGLHNRHKMLYFNIHYSRSRDFSELISLLNILREDPEFKRYHKLSITERTIEYLNNIQKEGNVDVHSIITQLPDVYPSEKKNEINTLLDSLLPLYKTISGKSIIITDNNTHASINKKLNLQRDLSAGNARDIIEDIKKMSKENMSDLIVDLKYDKLNEVITKILAEIITIESYEEYRNKSKICDFVTLSIKIRNIISEKIDIFSKVINIIISHINEYYVGILRDAIPELLDLYNLKNYCVDNNLIPKFIDLLCESRNFFDGEKNALLISKFSSELTKSNMEKIIKCTLENDQIHNSIKARRILGRLFITRIDIFDFRYNDKLTDLGMGIPDWMII